MFKKILSLYLIVLLLLTFIGCNEYSQELDSEISDTENICTHLSNKSPYEQGLELIELITEMAENEAYIKMATDDDAVTGIIKSFAGDRSKPLVVYAITLNKSIENMITEEIDTSEWSSMSKELRELIVNRYRSSILTAINSQGGNYTVAATSLCTAGKSFISEALKEDTIYLYTYENAKPVAITFTVAENNHIGASAIFVSNNNLNCSSAEEIEAFFNSTTDLVNVKVIEK